MVCDGIRATSEMNIWSVLQGGTILISAYFDIYLFIYLSILCIVMYLLFLLTSSVSLCYGV